MNMPIFPNPTDGFFGAYPDRENFYAILWNYRALLTEKRMLERRIKRLIDLNKKQTAMLQAWILSHPSEETRYFEARWKKENENG